MRVKLKNDIYDIDVDGDGKYKRMWNQEFNSATFITYEKHKDEIGCVYTCQGYDLNFAGIILGPDIYYDMQNKTINIDISKCYDKKTINKMIFTKPKDTSCINI